jgi:hypothetical protein
MSGTGGVIGGIFVKKVYQAKLGCRAYWEKSNQRAENVV